MSKIKGKLSIEESIQRLNNKYNGVSILDEKKKGGRIYWMDKLGYSTMFIDPEKPKEWLDHMLTGIPEGTEYFTEKGIPEDTKAAALTMVFGYSNYLISMLSDILAEKDLEIMIRNDYIQENDDFTDFMDFRNSALKE